MPNKECKYCEYCLENLMCLRVSCPKFDKQFAKYIIEKLKEKQYNKFETNHKTYKKLNNAKITKFEQLKNLSIINFKFVNNRKFKMIIKYLLSVKNLILILNLK